MKFARIGPTGKEVPALLHDTKHYSLEQIAKDIDADFWESDGPGRAAAALAAGELAELAVDGARIGAPITRPSAVICVGMNYAAHAAESGSAPPSVPIIFHKAPNTVAGPFDPVAIPRGSTKTDWEVELGVVIGRRASYLDSPAQARDHIAGFVTVNDLSERTFQLEVSGGQWSKGKSCAGFCPTGPYLVTPDEVDAGDLRLRSWVNGEIRQDSSTRDLIFGVEQVVYDLSQFLVLESGDLVCTGTPEGVALSGRFPYLRAGDVVELEVAGLGRQRQEFFQG
ncbi:fumarylacetoacetate hydrolase family protein [Pseudarthrobacter sp. C4D7]|uniref:fumarylacetoacetate hydrolase family protein n=1 Tax=Pseudarthrobacter sp. C4D7 TaxID=2735268 RepID=UPI001584C0D9|nr:fumarylacetoacetate hydrolase family protein [Pseudarthrobacter sp. C4D7]NUT71101.1 fumarylacetoacetate hydrolase family protein [Pseudarthrobacter sp. C4D7]